MPKDNLGDLLIELLWIPKVLQHQIAGLQDFFQRLFPSVIFELEQCRLDILDLW